MMAKISMLGSGTIGTIVGKSLLQLGNQVIFYDVDENKVKLLNGSGLVATSEIENAIATSEISFICVPTPVTDKGMDLTSVNSVVESLALCLRNKNDYHLVVVKSTVTPTTTEKSLLPLLEKISGKHVGEQIGVCVNPEFLTEISQTWSKKKKISKRFFKGNKKNNRK